MKKQRIAIYYDSLWIKGGAERVVCQLAKALDADIITCGLNPELVDWLDFDGKIHDLGNILIKKNKGLGMLIEAPLRYFFYRPAADYDLHIFMGFNSIFSARADQKNMWFCLTPNRMLYDHRDLKSSTGPLAKRVFFKLYQTVVTTLDQRAVKNIGMIIAQTKGVQQRIQKYYDRTSEVIYSPIVTKNYAFKMIGDFFLTVGRLVPEKRMTLIAEAFTKMANKKLVIVGDGPEKARVLELAAQHPNITLLSEVSDTQLRDLYAECAATIYMPMNEDFGLIPLEGMASGKVAIAVNEGGCLETIIQDVNGKLISPTVAAIRETVEDFDMKWAKEQKNDCMNSAKQFDIAVCTERWKTAIAAFSTTP